MQTLKEIRGLLKSAGAAPNKRLGQHFLIDLNLMGKLVALADVGGDQVVLEVGPGTGSLTEELLAHAQRVVAVELDRGLHQLLTRRYADADKLTLLHGDVLAGKHVISQEVVEHLLPAAALVANLPYNIATPLVAQCLIDSWGSLFGDGRRCRFDSLTFTVQLEVADRLAAGPDSEAYGQVSVLVALLGRVSLGPVVPASAFWPRPRVASRMLRIDLDPQTAAKVADVETLSAVVGLAFGQRRKQIASVVRRKGAAFAPDVFLEALEQVGIDHAARAQTVSPGQFLHLANTLTDRAKG